MRAGLSRGCSTPTISSHRRHPQFLITLQWILAGAFPLIIPRHWWVEPGAFITCCTAVGYGFALVSSMQWLMPLPAFLAALAWLWWLGLLVWKTARFAWRLVTRNRFAAS
jgi:hypothetical protein